MWGEWLSGCICVTWFLCCVLLTGSGYCEPLWHIRTMFRGLFVSLQLITSFVCPKVRRVNQVMQRPYFRSSYINSPSGTKWRSLHNEVFLVDLVLIMAHPAVLYPVIMDGYRRWQVLVLLLVPHYYYCEHYFWFLDQELIPCRYSSCSFCPFYRAMH